MDRIKQLNEFLKVTPDDAFLQYALAIEYIALMNDQEALSIFLHLVETQPEYYATYYHLGKLYERMQEPDLAEKIYEKGMEITLKLNQRHAHGELRGAYEELTF
jgi:tetratricopeptide (TPR) repeat protein